MEVLPETAAVGRREFSRGRWLLVFFFAVTLVGFGAIFIMVGRHAIQQRSYDMPWQESRGAFISVTGILGQSSSGVAHFRGADAVRVGAGFVLWGALLVLWGAMIVRSVFQRSRPSEATFARPHGAGWVLGITSFAMLLEAQGCFFPVWQTDGLVFWCVVVGAPVIVGLLMRAGKSRWTGIPFMVLIFLALLLPAPGISLAIAMGIFGTLFCLAHLVFLFPGLFREWTRFKHN